MTFKEFVELGKELVENGFGRAREILAEKELERFEVEIVKLDTGDTIWFSTRTKNNDFYDAYLHEDGDYYGFIIFGNGEHVEYSCVGGKLNEKKVA